MKTIRPPVIVVGAGPTGATAAILHGQRGVPVLVLERWPEVYPQPRAVDLDDEVCRIAARLGWAAVARRLITLSSWRECRIAVSRPPGMTRRSTHARTALSAMCAH